MVCQSDIKRIRSFLHSSSAANLHEASSLDKKLSQATILGETEIPSTLVTMLSRVRFTDPISGSEYCMTLTYPDSTSIPDAVSVFSKVGSHLLGLSVGATVVWEIPGGRDVTLKILEVTQPGH